MIADAKGAESSMTVEGNRRHSILRSGRELNRRTLKVFKSADQTSRKNDAVGTARWDGSAMARMTGLRGRWVWKDGFERIGDFERWGQRVWEVRISEFERWGRRAGFWERMDDAVGWVCERVSETKQKEVELHF